MAAAIVVALPRTLNAAMERACAAFNALAERRTAAIILVGVLPVAVRLLMLPIAHVPNPSIHDEFSHLLLGDTLASGRLANPAHPFWQHFETIHEIQQPTYSSMYPPLQGMFLAFGEKLFHVPWAGVVVSVALMFMSICWMLQGWMPVQWALYGTILAILKIGIVGFWMNSYMGGAAPAIAGALLLGAVPRLTGAPAMRSAILMALGIVMLLNSRPFEGGILTLCAVVYLLRCLWPQLASNPEVWLKRVIAPALAVVLFGFAFTAYYDFRVTGSPLRMPYAVNRDTYGWPENLAFLPPKKIHSVHPVLQAMYEKEIDNRTHYSSPARIVDSLVTRFFDSWAFYVGPALSLPLLVLPWLLRWKSARVLFGFGAIIAFVNCFQLLLYPQHLAPLCGVIVALLTFGVKYLYELTTRLAPIRAVYLLAVFPLLLGTVAVFKLEAEPLGISLSYWERAYEIHRDYRAALIKDLDQRPGKFLIIVRYAPWHSPDQEWVYNAANIDASKIVWAREMDSVSDAALIHYFSDREVFLLEADSLPIQLTPYHASSTAPGMAPSSH